MKIDAVIVYLPDLDDGILDGRAARVQDAAGEVGNVAHGRRDRIIDDDQVIVGIERQLVRIEGPLGQAGGARKLFGEGARYEKHGRANCQAAAQQPAPAEQGIDRFHDWLSPVLSSRSRFVDYHGFLE